MAALPFVFLTNELHVVPPIALEGGAPPPSIQITKFFLKSHVDEIKHEFFGVKSLGNGTAEEWLKGLEERGRKRRNDAARWERWQSSGGIARMRTTEPSERPSIRSFPRTIYLPEKPTAPQPTQPQTSTHSNTVHYMPATNMNNHSYPQSYAQPVQNAYSKISSSARLSRDADSVVYSLTTFRFASSDRIWTPSTRYAAISTAKDQGRSCRIKGGTQGRN